MKHRVLVDSLAKKYCFDPDDTHTYSYATALSKGERLERTLLVREFGAVTREGYKLEQHHHQAILEDLRLNEN